MLKIKDDVDLKKLKKFGFKYDEEEKTYYKYVKEKYDIRSERIEIPDFDDYNRQIRLFIDDEYYECWTSENSFDIVYDLIKADLVEKVEE